MRILMTTDTVGGVWTYAVELAAALQTADIQIVLATMGAPLTAAQQRQAARLSHVEVHESRFRLEWMPDPWSDVAAAGDWLMELARSRQVDLVHLNQFAFGALDWPVPCIVVGHSCVLSWHQAVRGRPAGREWDHYRRVVQAGLQSAEVVVAPTRSMLDMLDEHYGPLGDGRVIYNGRRLNFGGTAPKEPIVLAAGRLWDEAKNVAAVAAVAPQLAWPVQVAGLPHPDGAEDIPLAGVHFLGHLSLEQMEQAYCRASIFVSAARYEPFGLTALEAALCGCALVLSDIPTFREIWGDAAQFVPADDHAALARTIQMLINDNRLRGRCARAALHRARQLSDCRMAEEYLQVYHQLNQRRRGSPPTSDQIVLRAPRVEGARSCTL